MHPSSRALHHTHHHNMISPRLCTSILQHSHGLSGSFRPLLLLQSISSSSSCRPKAVAAQQSPTTPAGDSVVVVPSPAHQLQALRTAFLAAGTAALAAMAASGLTVADAAPAQANRAFQFLQGVSLPVLLQRQYAGKAAGGRGSSGLPPKVLTKRLRDADSPEQLLQLLQHHASALNHINLSAAYTRAAKLCRNGVPLTAQPAAVQRLLARLRQLAAQLQQQCEARQLANIMWACGRLRDANTYTGLLPVFLQRSKLQQADPQAVSNVLLAAATLQLQLTVEQHDLLLQRFGELLSQANPQDVSNTLWAVASMQQQVPPQQLQQMLQRFVEVLPQANPQNVSNTLWAAATLQLHCSVDQLQQMLQRFVEVLPQANPQNVSNTLWACGKLQYAPLQLLSALEQDPQLLQAVLAASKPQELTNMAWACGQLGYKGRLLPGALLQQAVRLQAGNTGGLTLQGLCNLCWAAAVLDLQRRVSQVLLAGATGCLWGQHVTESLQQLYQVHLWLLDSQLPAPGQGLSGVLSPQQLQQCKAMWEQQLAATAQQQVTGLQRSVFAAVQQLPAGTWQQQPQLEQRTPDGLFSVDITATTAVGVKLAIEVDGPSHFIQPRMTAEGAPHFRNRALAARGFVVVSIPHWEWNALRGAVQKQKYLLAKLPGLQHVPSKQHQS